jgi:hypothetical protein
MVDCVGVVAAAALHPVGAVRAGERIIADVPIFLSAKFRDEGVVAVLVAGGDHLHAEADHVGQAVDDLTGAPRLEPLRSKS